MKASLDRCNPLLQIRQAASTLEYSLVLGVMLAGIGGVLIAFSQEINKPILQFGASGSAFETPNTGIRELGEIDPTVAAVRVRNDRAVSLLDLTSSTEFEAELTMTRPNRVLRTHSHSFPSPTLPQEGGLRASPLGSLY